MKKIKNKNIISKVIEGSIAEELEVQVGDVLKSINSNEIVDIIDYLFLSSDEYIEIEIEKQDGEIWLLEVDKEYDEEFGIEFDNPILDHARSCTNKCLFCFIDQMPPNMRESLYFKDDDSRLSFLQGNFVTLTNVSDDDLDRMIRYQISPINVSVHTTNPELRASMLKNKFAGNILDRITYLTENNIVVNAQIVLCPCFNDGKELDRTLKDLGTLNSNLESVAVVPIGKTKFREGLVEVEGFDKERAQLAINQIEKWQSYFLETRGTRFVFLGDEFYVLAEQEVPSYETYEGFTMLEDGVGLMRKFEHEIITQLNGMCASGNKKRTVSVVTGVAAYSFMKTMADRVMEKLPHITIQTFVVKNKFFGELITVAGLLTGQDIIEELKGKDLGELLLMASVMFKSDEPVMLDDLHVDEVKEALNAEIKIVDVNGSAYINSILGNKEN